MRRATEEWGHGIKFVGCADGFVWLIDPYIFTALCFRRSSWNPKDYHVLINETLWMMYALLLPHIDIIMFLIRY